MRACVYACVCVRGRARACVCVREHNCHCFENIYIATVPSSKEKDESFLVKEMNLTSLTSGISKWSQM